MRRRNSEAEVEAEPARIESDASVMPWFAVVESVMRLHRRMYDNRRVKWHWRSNDHRRMVSVRVVTSVIPVIPVMPLIPVTVMMPGLVDSVMTAGPMVLPTRRAGHGRAGSQGDGSQRNYSESGPFSH